MTQELIFSSLYEFLGKPAGKELGAQVYEAAKGMGVTTRTREISNPKYTGKVVLYPQRFLYSYFNQDPLDTATTGDFQDNDLPF